MTTITQEMTAVEANVQRVCKALTGLSMAYYAAQGYDFDHSVYSCDWSQGRKYARVQYTMGVQNMVAFFVNKETGEVWKADGWKKPALNFVRGMLATDGQRREFIREMQNRHSGYFAF